MQVLEDLLDSTNINKRQCTNLTEQQREFLRSEKCRSPPVNTVSELVELLNSSVKESFTDNWRALLADSSLLNSSLDDCPFAPLSLQVEGSCRAIANSRGPVEFSGFLEDVTMSFDALGVIVNQSLHERNVVRNTITDMCMSIVEALYCE